MVISNSSSSSMTSSTMSSESAPISSVNEVERVTCSLFTPRFSQTISITRSSTEGTIDSSQADTAGPAGDGERTQTDHLTPGYVPQHTHAGQGNLPAVQVKRKGIRLPRTSKKGKIQGKHKKGKGTTSRAGNPARRSRHLVLVSRSSSTRHAFGSDVTRSRKRRLS